MAFLSIGFFPIPIQTPRLLLLPVRDRDQTAEACRVARIPDIRAALDLPAEIGPAELRGRLHAPPLRHLYLLQQARRGLGAGLLALRRDPDGSGWWQVGCGVLPPFRGRGYAQEAATEVLRRLFREPTVAGVQARVQAGHPAALALAVRMVPIRSGPGYLEFRLSREAWLETRPEERQSLAW